MKTRPSDRQREPGLPPPPAPTARDANPWPISSAPTGTQPPPGQPRAPGGRLRRRPPAAVAARRKRASPWVPLLVLVFIAGTGVQMAIRAFAGGDIEAAAGALVIIAFVAIIALRRAVKKSRD
jgi:hypothetical protein